MRRVSKLMNRSARSYSPCFSTARHGPLLMTLHPWNYSRFLRALFHYSNRAAGEAAEFSRSRVELLCVIGAARLECGEPAAEAGELIRRQLGNGFGDFFDFHFHVAQYSSAVAWLSDGKGLRARPRRPPCKRCSPHERSRLRQGFGGLTHISPSKL